MAKANSDAAKGAAAEAKQPAKEPSLYQALEKVAEKALTDGDHAAYQVLHPVVVALAGAKFAAGQAARTPAAQDALELLERVKSL
ncbi:hypothetical protein ACXKTX_09695 [Burkholderia gladioli]